MSQQNQRGANPDKVINHLLERIAQMERENAILKAILDDVVGEQGEGEADKNVPD